MLSYLGYLRKLRLRSKFVLRLVVGVKQHSTLFLETYTDVPSSRIIFILFHSSIHISSSHTFKYCTLCVLTEFNKIHDDDDDD